MQDPTAFQPLKPHFPEQEQLKCPRCESANTKFCYYNNYNLSQPRHFCKNCRRYWTKGGALRNIPVGGGSRKNTKRSSSSSTTKRSTSSSSSSSSANQTPAPESDSTRIHSEPADPEKRIGNIGGSFSSLLASTGHLGSLLEGLNSNGSSVKIGESRENLGSGLVINSEPGRDTRVKMQSNGNSASFLGMQTGESGYWNASSGWSDLAIYTPGSRFQ